ncbi:MAG: metallophosphoesterase [Gemmatimonadales bacterium]|nr:metallophosphoesterase [Gemmatimonadales bacterium]
MTSIIFLALLFISDVQIDARSSYPDSIAEIISEQIGKNHIYDCGDIVENGLFFEQAEYSRYKELFPNTTPVPGNHDYYDNLLYWSWATLIDTHDEGIHIIVGFDTGCPASTTIPLVEI